jgi:hypothetical protein
METHLENKFLSVRRYTPLFIWPYVSFYYARAKSVVFFRWGMSADWKPTRYRTIINIVHQHDRWMELKETLRAQTYAEV